MQTQLSEKYRLIGRSLYQLQNGSFIHVALVPPRIKVLASAVKWFESDRP